MLGVLVATRPERDRAGGLTVSTAVGGGDMLRTRLAALAALAVISRLPQLLSPNLLVDGDEAVVGLMAKHFAEGRDIPLFFWGQRYGFSTFEAGAAALAFRLTGGGAVALKAAMLALWTVGVLFLFLALARMIEQRRAFWIAVSIVLMPAWAVWSMKARGGYLTAFTASAILLWVVGRPRERDSLGWWMVAGTLIAIVYLAQPVWLPGVVPLVAIAIASRRRMSPAIACAATIAVIIAAVRLIPVASSETWAGPALGNPDVWGTRIRAAQQIYVSLTGSYYLTSAVDPPGRATQLLAVAWSIVLAGTVLMQAYRLATHSHDARSHVLFVSLWATLLANWFLLFARDARYLLPMSALLVMLAGIELAHLVDQRVVPAKAASALVGVMLMGGALSLLEFGRFSYLWTNPPGSLSEGKRLQLVINSLTSRGVHHAFSMNGLLDTQIIFYSGERVVARWASPNDRHPAYVSEVNRALDAGEPVAVVGYTDTSGAPGCWDVPICTGGIERLVANPEAIFTVDGKYFVYVGVDRALLRKLGFGV